MSELENSVNLVKGIIDGLRARESWIEQTSDSLAVFVSKHNRLILSYTGLGVIPAKTLFFSLSVLVPEKEFYLKSASSMAYHYLPYIDEAGGVVLFNGSSWERNELLRTLDTLNIMNTDYVIVLPSIPDDITSKRIESGRSIVFPRDTNIVDYVYLALKTALKSTIKMTGRSDMRIKRLVEETKELSSLLQDLEQVHTNFFSVMNKLAKSRVPVAILHSPSMEVPALLLQHLLINKRKIAIAMDLTVAPIESLSDFEVLAMYTGVESDLFREINFRLMKTGIRSYQLRSDFDPITNQFYLSIVVYSVIESLVSRGE